MTLSCAHESVNSLKAWVQSVLRNSSVSHSLGKRGGGSLCSLTGDGMPLYACSTSRSGQGILQKLRTLHPEQVRRVWLEGSLQTEGLCRPLRASAALLCPTGRNCCPERCEKEDGARSGLKPWICYLATVQSWSTGSASLSLGFLPGERRFKHLADEWI